MAVLDESNRRGLWAEFMSKLSLERESIGSINKNQLRAAVDAADDWVDTNAASFNAAIPLPARTELTAKQKAQLLAFVVERRFSVET